MNTFLLYLLIGLGAGIPLFFIGLWLFKLIRDTNQRRSAKRMLKLGQILEPLDKKDYDVKAWENQKYGNIDSEKNQEKLETLNEDIFKNEDSK